MTDALHPVANLVAVYEVSPRMRAPLRRHLQASGDFSRVWLTDSGWLIGARPVPSGPLNTGEDARLVCIEGLHTLRSLASDPFQSLAKVHRLASESPQRLDGIPGDFTFIQLGHHGRSVAVRSCSGRVPLYLHSTPERVAIATRLDYMVRYLPGEFTLDPLANGVWLSGFRFVVDERSLLCGVKVLQAGHFARLAPGQTPTGTRYWDPRPRASPRFSERAAAEHADELRHALLRTLERELSTTGHNAIFMSGGVDSTALTYLAAGTLGRPVSTITFWPCHPVDLSRELSYIEPARRDLRLEHVLDITTAQSESLALARETPDIVFQAQPKVNALGRLNAHAGTPAQVMIAGMFADEVSGSRRLLADWLGLTTLTDLRRLGRNVPVGRRIGLLWLNHRLRRRWGRPQEAWPQRLPPFIAPEIEAEYQDWRHARRRRLAADPTPLPMLFALLERNGWLLDFWEGATVRGTRPSTPFYTREILELAFRCHPREQFDAQTKKLLRQGLNQDVPGTCLGRQDKGSWQTVDLPVRWQDCWPGEVAGVLASDWVRGSRRTFTTFDAANLIVLVQTSMNLKKRRLERHSACMNPASP